MGGIPVVVKSTGGRTIAKPSALKVVKSAPARVIAKGSAIVKVIGGTQGTPGPPGPGVPIYTTETSADVIPGNAVYVLSNSNIQLAQADALPQARLFGLSLTDTLTGFAAQVATQGLVIQSEAGWDAVTGQTGGLTPGVTYWLDPVNAGKILTPASSTAPFCTFVGKALDSQTLDLDPRSPIKRA